MINLKIIGLCLLLGGCALYNPSSSQPSVIKECLIPADSTGTISGRWLATPIPIALHQNEFNTQEITSIIGAVETWNSFFNASKGKKIFESGTLQNPKTSNVNNPTKSGALCTQGIIQGNQSFNGNIVLYKLSRWPQAYPNEAIALTSFCALPAQPYPSMYMAVLEFNYQSYFIQGKKQPDLQSITLHELGHILGLNHSCESNPKKGTPNCNAADLNPEYIEASMFPVFSFNLQGQGQQKRSLGKNDQNRANCLY